MLDNLSIILYNDFVRLNHYILFQHCVTNPAKNQVVKWNEQNNLLNKGEKRFPGSEKGQINLINN